MQHSKRTFLKWISRASLSSALSPLLGLLSFPRVASAQPRANSEFGVPFLTPSSPDYSSATRTYYPSPCGRPERVYQPSNAKELSQLIAGLRSRGQRFAIRGGGHSFGNRSSNSNIVIDTSKLKGSGSGVQLSPQDGIVTVRAGARLGGREINPQKTKIYGLYDELAKNDRFIAAGTCPDVGVVGNILGGSLSAIPHFGYGARALREVTFVSFKDGKTYNVTNERIAIVDGQGRMTPVTINGLSGADMLKFFRGGGQASVGVVTEIKLQSERMSEFRAARVAPRGSLNDNISWLASLDPALRRQIYLEAHYGQNGNASQLLRVLAPRQEWPALIQRLGLEGRIKEYGSAREMIDSYLDNEGINSNQEQSRGANIMVPIDPDAINFSALRRIAGTGVDTALYQGPPNDGTVLPGNQGSFMIELEGKQNQKLNEMVLSVLKKGAPQRFANYVTTGVEAKPEEYFNSESLDLVRRAMDEFNPKVGGHRLSTSSLVDSSDTGTPGCDSRIESAAVVPAQTAPKPASPPLGQDGICATCK